jgi:UDP-N-acetylmuramyl pentapeptide phosphotransferase/UDP-N-acetylglucosamine-1-phosphate transferase
VPEWSAAFGVGVVATLLVLAVTRELFAAPVLARENYRGARIPTAAGLALLLALLVVEAGRATIGALGVGRDPGLTIERTLVLFGAFAFGLLGLVDDVLGGGDSRGFRGHLAAALRGRVTTGFVKLAGGGMIAVVLVATPGFATGRRLVLDAVLVALCANLANLFDRAPGRAIKIGLAAYAPLAVVLGAGPVGIAIAPVMGGALALAPGDLRERFMIGDTGANVLGAVLGLGVVLGIESTLARGLVLAAVAALNLASEVWSFSTIIERVAVLRGLDRAGRR